MALFCRKLKKNQIIIRFRIELMEQIRGLTFYYDLNPEKFIFLFRSTKNVTKRFALIKGRTSCWEIFPETLKLQKIEIFPNFTRIMIK